MRVISGTRKGIRLASFKGRKIRPTSDRTKELIFDVLGQVVRDASVLDLFAGTGGLGIEALSRGAAKAIFVDNHYAAIRIITENIGKTGFEARSEVLKRPVIKALEAFSENATQFDIIFADPPYEKPLANATLKAVEDYRVLRKYGWLVLEQRAGSAEAPVATQLILKTHKTSGDTQISFFQNDQET